MQKTSHGTADRAEPGSWCSTARRAIQSARLTGRLFSARQSKARRLETIKDTLDEAFEDTARADDQSESDAFLDPAVASRNVPRKASDVGEFDRGSGERVVLFAPRPVAEAALLREDIKRGATIRRSRGRRRRFRWLTDNAGTIVFVIGLLVLAWFVGAG